MYGNQKDIKYNLKLFFIDGILFTPTLTLISIATVIPFFLERLGASTFQIGIAASLGLVCTLITQPFFGSFASRPQILSKTFGKILLIQRVIFLMFVLSIPFLSDNSALLIWMFLVFWGIFNLFVGSYGVFYPILVLKLLPPDKRGVARGLGNAVGCILGVGATALIPVILLRFSHPYDFMIIFLAGTVFLLIDAVVFLLLRDCGESDPPEHMGVAKYIKGMPKTLRDNQAFRVLILTCTLLIAANSLLPYYTVYAIRIFHASEASIATFAAIAVIANAVGFVIFGPVIDRRGPIYTAAISACLVLLAGVLALVTNSLLLLYIAWAIANLGSTAYYSSMSLMMGEIDTSDKMPLFMGVYNTISMAFSAIVLLVLAPVLENVGFTMLFVTAISCGGISFLVNVFVLRKLLKKK